MTTQETHRSINRSRLSIILFSALATQAAFAGQYLSPCALAPATDGKLMYVAEADAKQVAVVNPDSGKVERSIALPEPVTGVAVAPDGATLYVTCASPNGKVYVFNAADGKEKTKIILHHTPMSPVVSPDGKRLYVCNRFSDLVSIVDLEQNKETARVRVAREPVAAVLTPDGKTLYVANHLPTGQADGAYIASFVTAIDVTKPEVIAQIKLPNGSTGLRGMCLSPDGKFVYVTHILGRYQVPTTQLERGWMNTNAMTIIDALGRKRVNTVLLDNVDQGAANPWGVVCTADGAFVCVAHAGTCELSIIDRAKLHARLDDVAAGKQVTPVSSSPENVPNDLSFLVGLCDRIRLPGKGPRAVAAIGTRVFAAQYFADDIQVIDVAAPAPLRPRTIALGPKPEIDQVRQGEIHFNDAALCFQHWQSCASCHPDGRADGLNWDLLNDGIGNPKQTKSMLLAHKTPPAMVSGVRDKAETAVRAGIRYIQFAVRPDEDAAAIDAYLASITPVPSPHLVYGALSPAAEAGKKLFVSTGCAQCHPGPIYTDLQEYDVGTATKGLDAGRKFDTPTLVECWRTAPYLYDGHSATMRDVLTRDNPGDRHGTTSKLSAEELDNLIEYILSL